MGAPTQRLAHGLDEIDLAELLNLVEELVHWLRVGTMEEVDGEREVYEHARHLLERYKPDA